MAVNGDLLAVVMTMNHRYMSCTFHTWYMVVINITRDIISIFNHIITGLNYVYKYYS